MAMPLQPGVACISLAMVCTHAMFFCVCYGLHPKHWFYSSRHFLNFIHGPMFIAGQDNTLQWNLTIWRILVAYPRQLFFGWVFYPSIGNTDVLQTFYWKIHQFSIRKYVGINKSASGRNWLFTSVVIKTGIITNMTHQDIQNNQYKIKRTNENVRCWIVICIRLCD